MRAKSKYQDTVTLCFSPLTQLGNCTTLPFLCVNIVHQDLTAWISRIAGNFLILLEHKLVPCSVAQSLFLSKSAALRFENWLLFLTKKKKRSF